MKTIGIIVGTEDEAISKQYYQKINLTYSS